MLKRFQLFELEDQPWFPGTIRDLATDYLHFMQSALKLDGALLPLAAWALAEGRTTRIVDLCSGGAGPIPRLISRLADEGVPATAVLTDLYPNIAAFERIAAASEGAITFASGSVDARVVPRELSGLRTLFNAFHHFRPADARAVLHAAAAARQPIAIFEVSQRSWQTVLPMVLTPLFVWISTIFIRPFRWQRILWTNLLPLVPLTCAWDGFVSQLRAYTPAELHQLCAGSSPMRWQIGQVAIAKGWGRLTFLVGVPADERDPGVGE
jgi:hypothetical protein